MGGDLTGEDLFERVVVEKAGEQGAVGRKVEGGQGAAFGAEAADEFGGEVGGLGGAAAVAGDEELVTAMQGGDDVCGGALDGGGKRGERLEGGNGSGDAGGKVHGDKKRLRGGEADGTNRFPTLKDTKKASRNEGKGEAGATGSDVSEAG